MAVEADRVVPPSGNLQVGGQQVWLSPQLADRKVTIWVDETSLHVLLDGARIKTLPSRLGITELARLASGGARPAGPSPLLAGTGSAIEIERTVNAHGLAGLAGTQVSVGYQLAGQLVCGYSRWASALLVPSRHAEDLFAGWWAEIEALGAVPRTLVWDGEGAIGRWRGRRSELTAECQAFRGTLAASVYVCLPRDPEAKGLVERFHDYLERAFLPGRTFESPADFNVQLAGWIATVNTRFRRHLECAPADRIAADRAAMIPLPPLAPVTGWRRTARLPRDHYVRLDSNDYSVDPAAVGRRIEVTADLARVRVWCEGKLAADHERAWARHQTITDPAHLAAARELRAAHRALAAVGRPAQAEVEQRDLAVYDALCDGAGQGVA